MRKLVSIITPCYNGERYLAKYFESLLAQTYPDIELFFVNDGSTDKTEIIALAYGEKLKAKGYGFTYIYQENAGQSAAINQGLKCFQGSFLNWTDADDYLPADSVEKRVAFLQDNPQVGLVIGRTIVVDDQEYKQTGLIKEPGMNRTSKSQLIEDSLKGHINYYYCCSTMVRSSMFRDSMPDPPQIETPREIGQNYQLFIPILLKYPVKYSQDVYGYYVIHSDSHSHLKKTFAERMHIQDISRNTLFSITERVKTDEEEKKWLRSMIDEYDCKKRLDILQHYRETAGLSDIVGKLKSLGKFDVQAKKMVLKIKYPFIKHVADILWEKRR